MLTAQLRRWFDLAMDALRQWNRPPARDADEVLESLDDDVVDHESREPVLQQLSALEFRRRIFEEVRESRVTSMSDEDIEQLAASYADTLPSEPPDDESAVLEFLGRRIHTDTAEIETLEGHAQDVSMQKMSAKPMGERAAPISVWLKLAATASLSVAFSPTLTTVLLRQVPIPAIAGLLGTCLAVVLSAYLVLVLLDEQGSSADNWTGVTLSSGVALGFALLRLDQGAAFLETLAYFAIEACGMGLLDLLGNRRRRQNAAHEDAGKQHEPFDRELDRIEDQIEEKRDRIDDDLNEQRRHELRRTAQRAMFAGLQARGHVIARGAIRQALLHNQADADRPRHETIIKKIEEGPRYGRSLLGLSYGGFDHA